jgi:hypothetical protein
MSKITIKDIDTILEEINTDIEKVDKDIKKNISKYNLNIKKIQECQEVLSNTQKELEITENSSEELINDKEFINYLNELDEVKKQISNNSNIKITQALDLYYNSIEKINKCKDYLENQKIEINNVD